MKTLKKMKKKYILCGVVALLLVVVIIVCVWYFSSKTFLKNANAEDVASISVFNGSTGKKFVIEDSGEIEFIVNNIQSIAWHRSGVSFSHDGYNFDLSFIDKDGKEIDSFILNNSYAIRKAPFFYNNTDIPACYDYLQALENKYTELSQRPENTTLEFWITENVSDLDLTKYQPVLKPSSWGYTNNAIYGTGYTSKIDSAGNEIRPENYVIYEIAPFPNNSASGEYITGIDVTDPSVYLYGLTVGCTAEEFNQTFEKLGFNVEIHDKSDREIERHALKDGIVIIFTKNFGKGNFGIAYENKQPASE